MHRILYIFIAFLSLMLTYGCQTEEMKIRLTREQKERLRKEDSAALKIGILPTEDCLPILVAKELRLFDTLGVSVHLRKYHALSECRKALKDSLVEGALLDSLLFSQMKANGTPLTGGLETNLSWKFLTSKKARIKRLEQLADKMVAADSHGMTHQLAEKAIDSLLKKKQMVFIIQVEDVRVRSSMLASGNIDAALLPEPFATKLQKQGAKWLKRVKSEPCGIIAMRKESMENKDRRKQLELFRKAVKIADDSINTYGKDNYTHLLGW